MATFPSTLTIASTDNCRIRKKNKPPVLGNTPVLHDPNQAELLKRNEVTPAAWKREQTSSALKTYFMSSFATVVGVLFLIIRKTKQCSINSKIYGFIFISLLEYDSIIQNCCASLSILRPILFHYQTTYKRVTVTFSLQCRQPASLILFVLPVFFPSSSLAQLLE